jgi:hypothetical protein
MNVRAAALWSGIFAGIALGGLIGCHQGLQDIDSTLRAAAENDFSRAGDFKVNFGLTMATVIGFSAALFCMFFIDFLMKNAQKD